MNLVTVKTESTVILALESRERAWDFHSSAKQLHGERTMTKKRIGDAWMPAADYGRAMPQF
jgi:hypothetical protein